VSIVVHFALLFLRELARPRDNICLENELAVKSHDKDKVAEVQRAVCDEKKLKGEGVNVLDIRE
jgi:uncharacterized membrane protein YvbJ